jgi:hypothetical protein
LRYQVKYAVATGLVGREESWIKKQAQRI